MEKFLSYLVRMGKLSAECPRSVYVEKEYLVLLR